MVKEVCHKAAQRDEILCVLEASLVSVVERKIEASNFPCMA
jgi:hypothetical protein